MARLFGATGTFVHMFGNRGIRVMQHGEILQLCPCPFHSEPCPVHKAFCRSRSIASSLSLIVRLVLTVYSTHRLPSRVQGKGCSIPRFLFKEFLFTIQSNGTGFSSVLLKRNRDMPECKRQAESRERMRRRCPSTEYQEVLPRGAKSEPAT